MFDKPFPICYTGRNFWNEDYGRKKEKRTLCR